MQLYRQFPVMNVGFSRTLESFKGIFEGKTVLGLR